MSQKPIGVLRFLGTNCDADVLQAFLILKKPAKYILFDLSHFLNHNKLKQTNHSISKKKKT